MAWGGIEVEAGVGEWTLTAKTSLPALLCVHSPWERSCLEGKGVLSQLGGRKSTELLRPVQGTFRILGMNTGLGHF